MKLRFYYDEFIFSHHRPENYDRCYLINFFGKKVHVCARCIGLYLSAILSFILYFFMNLSYDWNIYILYFFPIPAFIDWVLHRLNLYHGNNIIRTITGALMGLTYGRIAYNLITNPLQKHTYIVMLIYVSLAFTILFISVRLLKHE